MNSLFNPHRLALKVSNQPNFIANQQVAIFKNWHHLLSATDKTEEQLQADFLNDIFGEVLGYKYKRGEAETNLEKEEKTELDAKKPDGILGFFTLNQSKEQQDIRVIIELKGSKANLDARQNRDSKQTPVEQAFSYVSKYQKVEFVIVSNFKEIRLYQSHYQGKYQQFLMADLVHNTQKQQEFYFLLCKNNLIGFAPHTGSVIKQFIENETKHETEIKNKFYFEYKTHRQDFVTDILKQNSLSPSLAINKTQKLFDRLLFVRFCEDNNLLHKPFEKVYTGWALGLSLFDSLKTLFKSIDQGNPPHIHKFNGGLFAVDAEFDSLKINHDLLKKFIDFLRLYHFKNDLSVHILGHIFEQSLTDLQHLKASLNNSTHNIKEGKRKKDGIFYTPENITKYIVAKALGGWLKEQKDALQLSDFIFYELPENKPKKWQNPNQELIDRYKLYAKKLQEVKVLDPACGSGAFLIEVFNYLQNEWLELSQTLQKLGEEPEFGLFNYQNIYKSILQNNIYGVDINSESVQITKLSLWLKTANSQDSLTSLDNNIKIGNSLIADCGIDEKAFNWQQEFNFKFDVVVGNPPYVRQELFSSIKPYLQQNYSVYAGTADLYCYFYEKATQLLAPNGRLGFITSNKWMRANYGLNLRKFILANTKIQDFIDLGGQEIFKGVGVDANILLYQKTQATDDYVFCVGDNLSTFSEFASNHLDVNCFNIATNNLARNIKTKIETLGVPLKNWDVKINYGIKTGFNEAFIIDTKTKEELCLADAKSAEIIKPILRGRDISRYSTKWAGLWIINTHNGYKKPRSYHPTLGLNHPPLEASNLQNTRSYHPPLEGGSKLLCNFGEGYKNPNTNSKPNFAENDIYPSPKASPSTLPQGEGNGTGEGDKIGEGNKIENYSKKTLNFAKELRKSQTNAEGLLWYYLRNKQLGGYKFRRQQPIDKYIVDFVCFEKNLIIELDGSQHNENKNIKHDKIRDALLTDLGFTILRFWNDEIFTNCANILDFILHKLESPRSYHPPLEGGSNGLMPFGEGYKNPNTNSKPNFAENDIDPSQNLQANSTLPQGEGDKIGEGDGTEYISRIDVEKDYPAIFAYLKKFQNQLENRADKGDHWTNLRNCAYFEEFKKEKVVYSEIVREPQFYYDEQNFYLEATSFVMTGENLKYLTAILNSKPCAWIFKTFYAGGGLGSDGIRYKKVFLQQLPVPQISSQAQQPFIEKAQQMLDLNRNLNKISDDFLDYLKAKMQNPAVLSAKLNNWQSLSDSEFLAEITKLAKQQKLTSFDDRAIFNAFKEDVKKTQEILLEINQTNQQIDAMVYELYNLSQQEIALIDIHNDEKSK